MVTLLAQSAHLSIDIYKDQLCYLNGITYNITDFKQISAMTNEQQITVNPNYAINLALMHDTSTVSHSIVRNLNYNPSGGNPGELDGTNPAEPDTILLHTYPRPMMTGQPSVFSEIASNHSLTLCQIRAVVHFSMMLVVVRL